MKKKESGQTAQGAGGIEKPVRGSASFTFELSAERSRQNVYLR